MRLKLHEWDIVSKKSNERKQYTWRFRSYRFYDDDELLAYLAEHHPNDPVKRTKYKGEISRVL